MEVENSAEGSKKICDTVVVEVSSVSEGALEKTESSKLALALGTEPPMGISLLLLSSEKRSVVVSQQPGDGRLVSQHQLF